MKFNMVCKGILLKVILRCKDTSLISRPTDESCERKVSPCWRRLWGQQHTQWRAGCPIGKEVKRMLRE